MVTCVNFLLIIAVFDRYQPNLFIGIIVVLSLSMLDAIFTLTLISRGAKELNPVMRYHLNHGPKVFNIVKYGLTALPVLIILCANEALANRCRIGAGVLFYVFGAFFIGVVFWEVFLYVASATVFEIEQYL